MWFAFGSLISTTWRARSPQRRVNGGRDSTRDRTTRRGGWEDRDEKTNECFEKRSDFVFRYKPCRTPRHVLPENISIDWWLLLVNGHSCFRGPPSVLLERDFLARQKIDNNQSLRLDWDEDVRRVNRSTKDDDDDTLNLWNLHAPSSYSRVLFPLRYFSKRSLKRNKNQLPTSNQVTRTTTLHCVYVSTDRQRIARKNICVLYSPPVARTYVRTFGCDVLFLHNNNYDSHFTRRVISTVYSASST